MDDAPDGKHVYYIVFDSKRKPDNFTIKAQVTGEQPFELSSLMTNIDKVEPLDGTTLSSAYTATVPSVFPNVIGGAVSLVGLQRGVYAVQLGSLGSTFIRIDGEMR